MRVLEFFHMGRRNLIHVPVFALIAMTLSATLVGTLVASEDECDRTVQMRVYSNAYLVKEVGDVVGYELAVQRREGNSIDALLYVYEGAPNKDGISVSGHIAGGKLVMEGDRVEHLIEQPSNKEIVETHHVTVNGALDSTWFRGTIMIAGFATPIKVRLRHVTHIWLCRGGNK
ncbi:MAG TPA: hypothetical protein VKR82_04710 [Candidatus Acidoferrales bacterium]|nr:hypothetical protein [Candidatus Acidoferrales bacterium]